MEAVESVMVPSKQTPIRTNDVPVVGTKDFMDNNQINFGVQGKL